MYVLPLEGVFIDFDPLLLFCKMCKRSNDSVILKKSYCLQIVLIFYAFSFYIITVGYKGTLVSYLTVPIVLTPIGGI